MLEEKYGELLLDYILLALDGEYKGRNRTRTTYIWW